MQSRSKFYYALTCLGPLLAAPGGALLFTRPVLGFGLAMAGLVLSLIGFAGTWRRTDEVAAEAHKFAWFWGGGAGFMAGTVAIILFAAVFGRGPVTVGLEQCLPVQTGHIDCTERKAAWPSNANPPAARVLYEERVTLSGDRGQVIGFLAALGLVSGMTLLAMFQVIGYGLAWLGWWRTRQ